MTLSDTALFRLFSQNVPESRFDKPGDVVRWMGAMQAQDYPAALWGIGLRTNGATENSIEHAIAARKIIRTWPMRGTLHFVAPRDVRWMLKYLTPRIAARGSLRFRQLDLDEDTFQRSGRLLEKALEGGNQLARDKVYALLERGRISCKGQRGIHILWKLAQEGLICLGPRDGKQPTFVLLEEWIPTTPMLTRDEALAELAQRYFVSHGPATLQDFVWWSGLTVSDARISLDAVKYQLAAQTIDGLTYWFSRNARSSTLASSAAYILPAFDEFLVGYKDRTAAIDRRHLRRMRPGGGILHPTVVVGGRIVGTWKRSVKKDKVEMRVSPFGTLDKIRQIAIEGAAQRYGSFLAKHVVFRIDT